MSKLSKVSSDDLRGALGTRNNSAGILAINAASAATIKTTNALAYMIRGIFYSKTALAAQSFAVTHRFDGNPVSALDVAYVQPANTTVFYLVSVNAAGTVAVSQGSYAGQAITYGSDLSKIIVGSGDVPELPAGYCPIGVVKVVTGATTFTPGTTALDAASVTATYKDVSLVPLASDL